MKQITVVAAALIKNNKVFIARRPANKLPPLVWEFPGGKPELGETLPQALKRELYEELNIDTQIGSFITKTKHLYDFAEVKINLFWAYMTNPNDQITDIEHIDTAWVSSDKLFDYNFAEADIPLAKYLQKIGF